MPHAVDLGGIGEDTVLLRKIRATVKDPKTAELLCPNDHPMQNTMKDLKSKGVDVVWGPPDVRKGGDVRPERLPHRA
jgi:hypothetical protein